MGALLAMVLSAGASAPATATMAMTQLADFTVGGSRPVTVHVPSSYRADHPAPLLIMLHGWGSSGAQHESYLQLAPVADARGVLYAYPNGARDRHGDRFWNATDACCDFGRRGVDDVSYLTDLVKQSTRSSTPRQTGAIRTPSRVYTTLSPLVHR